MEEQNARRCRSIESERAPLFFLFLRGSWETYMYTKQNGLNDMIRKNVLKKLEFVFFGFC